MSKPNGKTQTPLEAGKSSESNENQEKADRLLDRAVTIYGICLRDYFSTFSTYTTATSILVAALGFLAKNEQSPTLIIIVAGCGLLLCFQWHISTASLRDQYAFFRRRIRALEKDAKAGLMSEWLDCVAFARGIEEEETYPEIEKDLAKLNRSFKYLGRRWALRGAMLPVIYSAVFVAVIISSLPLALPKWVVPGASVIWLFLWTMIVHWSIPHLTRFKQPTIFDRLLNRGFGFLIRIGFALPHNFLLEVRGRKTGRIYSTPVNVLEYNASRYIVAPRGYTQWVRNVLSSGEASLLKGRKREKIKMRAIGDNKKSEILKAYLDRFKLTVQRYFTVRAGSPVEQFEPLRGQYPVFEVLEGE